MEVQALRSQTWCEENTKHQRTWFWQHGFRLLSNSLQGQKKHLFEVVHPQSEHFHPTSTQAFPLWSVNAGTARISKSPPRLSAKKAVRAQLELLQGEFPSTGHKQLHDAKNKQLLATQIMNRCKEQFVLRET